MDGTAGAMAGAAGAMGEGARAEGAALPRVGREHPARAI
jgi:hypothetical protein